MRRTLYVVSVAMSLVGSAHGCLICDNPAGWEFRDLLSEASIPMMLLQILAPIPLLGAVIRFIEFLLPP